MQTESSAADLTVAQVAARSGVRPDTLRYYERIGLLPAPRRTSGEHRRYDEAVIERLQFPRGGQRLGLHLTEIRELLAVRDTGECPCEPAETLLRRHLDEIDAEMRRLTALRANLEAMLAAMPGPAYPSCRQAARGAHPRPSRKGGEPECSACAAAVADRDPTDQGPAV